MEAAIPTCRDMAELVTDYMEGALPRRGRLGVRMHLALCQACRHYFAQMRQTIGVLKRGQPVPPDPAIEESLVRAASEQPREP